MIGVPVAFPNSGWKSLNKKKFCEMKRRIPGEGKIGGWKKFDT